MSAPVHALVLYGSYARRVWAQDYPWALPVEERAVHSERLVTNWDWKADIVHRCPSADAQVQEWSSHRMRASATPGTVRALLQMSSLVDVRSLLPNVKPPTLLVHRAGDQLAFVQESRYMA
jgi:hypothetical protein